MDLTDDVIYRVTNVQRRLGAFALSIAELEIRRGEVLAVIGPIGAGKTTLLRLLAALDQADHGDLSYASQMLVPLELALGTRRQITMVHQRPLLLTGSVRYNVEYGLRIRGRHDHDRVSGLLETFGLSSLANQSARTLSGGQVQLVALARSLIIEPQVLLLDEPTNHLDPSRVAAVEQSVEQLRRRCKTTVVWATHNLFQARRVADRTALLLEGKVVEMDSTDTFFHRPSDPRTADFVQGRMVY